MTEPEITPGTWEVVRIPSNQLKGLYVRQILPNDRGLFLVKHTFDGVEAEANMKLIAAAPDMYKVMENVASYLESFKDKWLEGDELLYCEVTGAMNKAQGGDTNEY